MTVAELNQPEAVFADALRAEVYYRGTLPSLRGAPEADIVRLVRGRRADTLRSVMEFCRPLPSSAIGAEAFEDAAFEWTLRCAADPVASERLSQLCLGVLPVARAVCVNEYEVSDRRTAKYRITQELKHRWSRFAADEPLLAVHLATWLAAMTLVWRGLSRSLPFIWPEAQLIETALVLQELAPKLLAHDLVKVCAIEAIVAAGIDDAPGSWQADN